jgi:cell division protein FtsB
MNITRRLKWWGKAVTPPLLFLSLVSYFLWQATQGEHGLRAYALRQKDLIGAQAELARTEADLAGWDRRVAAMRSNHLDPDALDERSRAMLNLSQPNDIVVPYGNGQKLF